MQKQFHWKNKKKWHNKPKQTMTAKHATFKFKPKKKYSTLDTLIWKTKRLFRRNALIPLGLVTIISYFLASKTEIGTVFDILAVLAGTILLILLLIRGLKWTNRINLSSDLNFFGLKIAAIALLVLM